MLHVAHMLRYLILSVFLHLFVIAIFIYRKVDPIDEPIVSVSVDLSARPAVARTKKQAVPSLQANAVTPQKNEIVTAPTSAANTLPNSAETSAYESGNVTTKPRVLKQVQITYPQSAKAARIEGPVKLSVLINDSGLVSEVNILQGPGYGLDEAAREALKQFIFSPAEVMGQKVPVRIVYIYRFKLESR